MNPLTHPERSTEATLARRQFISRTSKAVSAATIVSQIPLQSIQAAAHAESKMKICLTPGSIGVSAGQNDAIALAAKYGFEAVEPYGGHIADLTSSARKDLLKVLEEKKLVWGAAGLTVDFRGDETKFNDGLKDLPRIAAALKDVGVDRVGTWLMPCHESLTYLQNFKQHADRLRKVASILKDNGQRLGMEYVGTHTLWTSRRYPFVHSLHETLELADAIGTGNIGLVLDSWHWWQAGDSVDDILSLKNKDVVSVDLNDAPAGVEKHDQVDGRRELPAATGVIDINSFATALQKIGYDGPVRPEPFNQPLRDLDNDAACATTITAMKKGLAAVR